jgi:RNA polymerase II subunit A-like phosphatase
MSHDTASLTVSLEEASRIEKQTSTRLLKEKKLSLIVDLDQTVIQATVDPTVGDWMFDEKNPNHAVLKDCERFRLPNEMGQEEGCYYYVKPRSVFRYA